MEGRKRSASQLFSKKTPNVAGPVEKKTEKKGSPGRFASRPKAETQLSNPPKKSERGLPIQNSKKTEFVGRKKKVTWSIGGVPKELNPPKQKTAGSRHEKRKENQKRTKNQPSKRKKKDVP